MAMVSLMEGAEDRIHEGEDHQYTQANHCVSQDELMESINQSFRPLLLDHAAQFGASPPDEMGSYVGINDQDLLLSCTDLPPAVSNANSIHFQESWCFDDDELAHYPTCKPCNTEKAEAVPDEHTISHADDHLPANDDDFMEEIIHDLNQAPQQVELRDWIQTHYRNSADKGAACKTRQADDDQLAAKKSLVREGDVCKAWQADDDQLADRKSLVYERAACLAKQADDNDDHDDQRLAKKRSAHEEQKSSRIGTGQRRVWPIVSARPPTGGIFDADSSKKCVNTIKPFGPCDAIGSRGERSKADDLLYGKKNTNSRGVHAGETRKDDGNGRWSKAAMEKSRLFWRGSPPSSSESLKQQDSSENTCNSLNDSEDDGSNTGHKSTSKLKRPGSMSKNLVSERRRRQKLNEKLYSLRALVPKISKMDKASIVGDAIHYVRDLKKQVEDMEEDIAHLEACKEKVMNGIPHHQTMERKWAHQGAHVKKPTKLVHHILELDVTQMEEKLFQFRIHCKKSPGVLLQLARALESLDIEIVNGSLTSINDHILNTLVIEVDGAHIVRTEELRDRTLAVIAKFGLILLGN